MIIGEGVGILDMRFVLFEEDYWRGSGMIIGEGVGILARELDGMLRYGLIGRYLELEMEMRYGWSIEGKLSFVLFGMEIGSVMESSLGD